MGRRRDGSSTMRRIIADCLGQRDGMLSMPGASPEVTNGDGDSSNTFGARWSRIRALERKQLHAVARKDLEWRGAREFSRPRGVPKLARLRLGRLEAVAPRLSLWRAHALAAPPATAFISPDSDSPAIFTASSVEAMSPRKPGTMLTPAFCASFLDSILSPIAAIALGGGPMKAIFALASALAKLSRSLRKP